MSTGTLHAKAKLSNQKGDVDKNHNNFSMSAEVSNSSTWKLNLSRISLSEYPQFPKENSAYPLPFPGSPTSHLAAELFDVRC